MFSLVTGELNVACVASEKNKFISKEMERQLRRTAAWDHGKDSLSQNRFSLMMTCSPSHNAATLTGNLHIFRVHGFHYSEGNLEIICMRLQKMDEQV